MLSVSGVVGFVVMNVFDGCVCILLNRLNSVICCVLFIWL